MALSGSVSTSKYDGRYYTLSWTATQSIDKNTSTIKWTLKAVGANSSWYAERTVKVVLGGSTVYSKTSRVERYTGTVTSGTKTITHNSSGDASFKVSLECAVYTSSVNCTGSKTFTLDNIPRKSTLSVDNGTLGTAQTLTVTRKSTSFTHTITYKCGTASGTIATKSTSTSISFTPPLSLASQNTTGTSVSITYTITTYNGSTSIGSNTYTKTCTIPSSVKPTVSLTVAENVTKVADVFGVYVKGLSKLKITATGTGAYSSTIKSYKITANDETFTTASATTSVLKSSGSLTITVTVTDSRGRTGSASKTITVYNYSKPVINIFEGVRCDEDGTENDEGNSVLLTLKGSVTNLTGNTATYKVSYKKSSDSSYTNKTLDVTALSINQTYILNNIDTETSYDIKFTITDAYGNSSYVTISISTAFTLVDYHESGKGMSIGKVSELEGVFDIGLPVKFSGGIYSESHILWSGGMYMTAGHTINLSEKVSKQPNGIVIVFSPYIEGVAKDYDLISIFIPKYLVSVLNGKQHTFQLVRSKYASIATKILNIYDDHIVGNEHNNASGTSNGITYNNSSFIMRYVIGV